MSNGAAPLTTRTLVLAGVPALVVGPSGHAGPGARGTVLVLHGLGASKDLQRPELESLAQGGFLAVGLDAVGHGDRVFPDFLERFGDDAPQRHRHLMAVVRQGAEELPAVAQALVAAGLAEAARLGAVGISLGANTLYRALSSGLRLPAAVALLGSPDFGPDDERSPHRFPERLPPTALLSLGAGQDTVVNPRAAEDFHRALAPHYAAWPSRHRHHLYPASDHLMREQDWLEGWQQTMDWLGCHLAADGGVLNYTADP